MKNIRILLILQVLTLAAAIIGASAYFINDKQKQKGVVKGILYTVVDSTVMVDNQVLSEGETIYGTRVTKIYPKKVEFEKNGKCWSQRICEQPNPFWDDLDDNKGRKEKK